MANYEGGAENLIKKMRAMKTERSELVARIMEAWIKGDEAQSAKLEQLAADYLIRQQGN